MQLRVVTDQPWNVPADVLVLAFVGDPVFEGELAEIDRRAGGELHVLAGFRELRSERYETALSSAGQLPVGRLLAIAAGPAAGLDREVAVRLGAAIQRRLAGRPVRRLAVWLGALAASLDGGVEAAAELVTRGIVEGGYDPGALYGTGDAVAESGPPAVEELILIVPPDAAPRRGDARRRARRRDRRGHEPDPPAREPVRERRQRRRSSRTRRARSRPPTGLPWTCSTRSRPRSSAWGCFSRWGREAQTRRA